jgi:hypothetical protein
LLSHHARDHACLALGAQVDEPAALLIVGLVLFGVLSDRCVLVYGGIKGVLIAPDAREDDSQGKRHDHGKKYGQAAQRVQDPRQRRLDQM